MSKPPDLVQGTLDLLLLKLLALEPQHGWAISERLKQVSADVLHVSDGSLYPALHKPEQEGWITAHWQVTENTPFGASAITDDSAMNAGRSDAGVGSLGPQGRGGFHVRRAPCGGEIRGG